MHRQDLSQSEDGRSGGATALCAILLLAVCGRAPAADEPHARMIGGVLPLQGHYVPDRWVPVRLLLKNDTDQAVPGEIQIGDEIAPVLTGTGAGVSFRQRFDVPAHSRVKLATYAFFNEHRQEGRAPLRSGFVGSLVWRSEAGAEISRQQKGFPGILCTSMVLSVGSRGMEDPDSPFSAFHLPDLLDASRNRMPAVIEVPAPDLPVHCAGYDAVRAIIFNDVNADDLDVGQRRALEDYVLRGGVLIVHCPSPRDSATWLAGLLPVHIIGRHEAEMIDASSTRCAVSGPIPLGRRVPGGVKRGTTTRPVASPLPLTEAVEAAGATVVLSDASFVHAAYRSVGLGRVVFTSFPLGAMAGDDPRTTALWSELMGPGTQRQDWRTNGLFAPVLNTRGGQPPLVQEKLMQGLIGLSVPRWGSAALIVGIYLVLLVGLQLTMRGARRPTAFVLGAGLAVALAGAVIVLKQAMRGAPALAGGRLATVDLSAEGGGRLQEVVCYYGLRDPALTILGRDGCTLMRPVLSAEPDPATVRVMPPALIRAGTHEDIPRRFWLADSAVPRDIGASASIRFTTGAPLLSTSNRTGRPLRMPLLLHGSDSFRLDGINMGDGSQPLEEMNEPGSYNLARVLSEDLRLREEFLRQRRRAGAFESRDGASEPELIAWSDNWPTALAPGIAVGGRMLQTVMVLVPARFEALPVGTKVRIASAFTTLTFSNLAGLPYNPAARQWMRTSQMGTWTVGFAYPPQIGRLKVQRCAVEADIAAPRHTLSLAGRGGTGRTTFDGPLGVRKMAFSPAPSDVDANGWVWLELRIDGGAAPGELPAAWEMRGLRVSYEAEVVGPPFAPMVRKPASPVTRRAAGK